MSENSQSRPKLRSAEEIAESSFRAALAGDDIEAMRRALIDGCRSLDAAVVYPLARRMISHSHDSVRWAAFFALDFMKHEVVKHVEDEDDVVFEIGRIASDDPSPDVRAMAAQTLVAMVFLLARG